MKLDLTPEERQEYIEDCIDEFKENSGSVVAEQTCRIRLSKAGIDRDEIDYIIKANRP